MIVNNHRVCCDTHAWEASVQHRIRSSIIYNVHRTSGHITITFEHGCDIEASRTSLLPEIRCCEQDSKCWLVKQGRFSAEPPETLESASLIARFIFVDVSLT